MRREEKVLKVEFLFFYLLVSKNKSDPNPSDSIFLVRQRNTFLPRQTWSYGVSKISRLPYKTLQSLIVVVSEWRKGQLKQHYSVTAEENFVRMRTEENFVHMRTEGGCCWPTFKMCCWSAWSALTEQLMINDELAPRVGVREETKLYQHALNVYMLISSL